MIYRCNQPVPIQNNEVWIKFGGDYGGETFKLWLAVMGLHDTVCIVQFAAKEIYSNLTAAINLIKPEIIKLKATIWRYSRLMFL